MQNTTSLLALTEQTSLENAWLAATELLRDYGFDRIFYGYTDLSTARSLGSPSDALIMTNLSDEYTKHYVEDGGYHHGPMTVWAGTNVGSCSWSRIPEIISDHTHPELMMANVKDTQKFGLLAGYTISFRPTGTRSKAAIGLCANSGLNQDQVDAIWSESGPEIELICTLLHLQVMALPHNFGRKTKISDRQREVLELKALGKSVADISQILEIAVSTVEKHIAAAKTALGVETVAQAISILTSRNQFFQIGVGPADRKDI